MLGDSRTRQLFFALLLLLADIQSDLEKHPQCDGLHVHLHPLCEDDVPMKYNNTRVCDGTLLVQYFHIFDLTPASAWLFRNRLIQAMNETNVYTVVMYGLHTHVNSGPVIEKMISSPLKQMNSSTVMWPKVVWLASHKIKKHPKSSKYWESQKPEIVKKYNLEIKTYIKHSPWVWMDMSNFFDKLYSNDGVHHLIGGILAKLDIVLQRFINLECTGA